MTVVSVDELRRRAGELVRRAEAGEIVTVTRDGRPAARLGPRDGTRPRRWRRTSEVLDELASLGTDDELAAELRAESTGGPGS